MTGEGKSIIVLAEGITFSEGSTFMATFYNNQTWGKYSTNISRKGVTVVEPTFSQLLRHLADLWEQEKGTSLAEFSTTVQRMTEDARRGREQT